MYVELWWCGVRLVFLLHVTLLHPLVVKSNNNNTVTSSSPLGQIEGRTSKERRSNNY